MLVLQFYMYNGQIINALLKQQGKKKKDLLEALGVNYGGSIRPFVEGNPTVGKLEAIADFFGVSMDTFFIRDKKPSISVIGNSNNVACVTIKGLEERNEHLHMLIEEKDKRIALLESMNELLQKEIAATKK